MNPKSNFYYGAVFKVQREHSREQIRRELEAMKQSGMNTVVVWPSVYWWEDRNLPNYPYDTGHYILHCAEEIGLQIIMELSGQITSLEYAPDFVMKQEYYAVKYDGTYTNDYLYFGYLNYNHPEVRELILKQFAEIASHYRSYSSLYGYDIWNETMFESYDTHTLQRYRQWLESKYGTIGKLNDVWDRVYASFDDVHFNRWMWASVMPVVDYRRFQKESIGMFLDEWALAVRAADPNHPIIADNIHSAVTDDGYFSRPQDDWNVARHVDEFGISFYPKTTPNIMPPHKRWLTLTGAHSASPTGRFWISELQTHMKHMFNPESAVTPRQLKLWVWEAIAHGAKGLIYWKWDPFNKGLQTGGRGLVDYQGRPTPRLQETIDIARAINNYEREFAAYEPQSVQAFILFDKDSHNFSKAYMAGYKPHAPDSIYLDSIAGLHRLLWTLNISVKIVTPEDVMNGLPTQGQVLFMTNQLTMSDQLAEAIRTFTASGGVVVADGKLGEVDENGVLHRRQPGGLLRDWLGCELIDIEPEGLTFEWDGEGDIQQTFNGFFERKRLEVNGSYAAVRGAFADGSPAIVDTRLDQGRFFYIATHLWYGYDREMNREILHFMRRLTAELGLSRISSEEGEIRLKWLQGDDGLLLFAFNYGESAGAAHVTQSMESGSYRMENVYSGEVGQHEIRDGKLDIRLHVEANDVSIVKLSRISD